MTTPTPSAAAVTIRVPAGTTATQALADAGMPLKGADGTAVYPGMLAGPPSYEFGTVVALDGLGVGTVHDRGSRIVEWNADLHRLAAFHLPIPVAPFGGGVLWVAAFVVIVGLGFAITRVIEDF